MRKIFWGLFLLTFAWLGGMLPLALSLDLLIECIAFFLIVQGAGELAEESRGMSRLFRWGKLLAGVSAGVFLLNFLGAYLELGLALSVGGVLKHIFPLAQLYVLFEVAHSVVELGQIYPGQRGAALMRCWKLQVVVYVGLQVSNVWLSRWMKPYMDSGVITDSVRQISLVVICVIVFMVLLDLFLSIAYLIYFNKSRDGYENGEIGFVFEDDDDADFEIENIMSTEQMSGIVEEQERNEYDP